MKSKKPLTIYIFALNTSRPIEVLSPLVRVMHTCYVKRKKKITLFCDKQDLIQASSSFQVEEYSNFLDLLNMPFPDVILFDTVNVNTFIRMVEQSQRNSSLENTFYVKNGRIIGMSIFNKMKYMDILKQMRDKYNIRHLYKTDITTYCRLYENLTSLQQLKSKNIFQL